MEVAERTDATILSLDSMQVYRGMDIGTAKATPEERRRVPHAMIDLIDPSEEFSVQEFQDEARRIIDTSEKPVILVGGSGLHMRAVIDPLEFLPTDATLRAELEEAESPDLVAELLASDPEAGARVDLANPRRVIRAVEVHRLTGRTPSEIAGDAARTAVARYEPRYRCRIVGVDPGDALAERIDRRLDAMMEAGLLDEVERLEGSLGRTASQAVGYAQLLGVVGGDQPLERGVAATRKATWDLARHQRAWFRKDPRIRWVDPTRDDVVAAVMEKA